MKYETVGDAILDRFDSVAAMARETGIDRTQIYRAIRGEGITLETARRMAEALTISLDKFVKLWQTTGPAGRVA